MSGILDILDELKYYIKIHQGGIMSRYSYDDENGFIPVPLSKMVFEVLRNMLWIFMFFLSATYLTTHAWN